MRFSMPGLSVVAMRVPMHLRISGHQCSTAFCVRALGLGLHLLRCVRCIRGNVSHSARMLSFRFRYLETHVSAHSSRCVLEVTPSAWRDLEAFRVQLLPQLLDLLRFGTWAGELRDADIEFKPRLSDGSRTQVQNTRSLAMPTIARITNDSKQCCCCRADVAQPREI